MGKPQRRNRRPDAGAGEQRGQASDARAERPVGEGRRHLPDRAIEAVAEQQQQQDDLDPAMSPNGGDALENVAREMLGGRALLPISGRRAHRRDAEEEQPVAEDVAGEGGGRSEAQDDPAGERGTDKQPELAIGGADRDRRGQSAGRDEARQQPVARGDAECVRGAVDGRERGQRMDRQRAGKRQPGEDRGLGRRAGIS